MRVGFIGVGGISGNYRRTLKQMPDVQIAAVCDIDEARARAAAAEVGAQVFTDHRRMLDAGGLDAVFVCIPPFAHA
ncbi:MAG TPA: Gfo/Idh/MocA family oxidoreductase, partial [Limnochordia bacterium]|nr:Gfo/Idh/MocA family oxidoreductase [Limnochordia bacterium]